MSESGKSQKETYNSDTNPFMVPLSGMVIWVNL